MAKRMIGILLLTVVMTVTHGAATAQATTQGRDFWVAFLVNGGYQTPKEQRLIAVSDTACDILVDNERAGIHLKAHLEARESVEMLLPSPAAMPSVSGWAANNAFHVTSTAAIWLYAANSQLASSSMTPVLPTALLDTLYIVQDYPGDYSRTATSGAEVAVVATADSTALVIVLTGPTAGTGLSGDDTLRLTLNRGQSLMLDTPPPYSFSGMRVSANHPIALFQGNKITGIPAATPGGDMLYEQALPVNSWGTKFIAIGTPGRSTGDYLRITAAYSGTLLHIEGEQPVTLHAGETFECRMASADVKHISSNLPVCVGLYQPSSTYRSEAGDCSQLMVTPLGCGVSRAAFSTFGGQGFKYHAVNILVPTAYVTAMRLDGADISRDFLAVDNDYSMASLTAGQGFHLLENSEGTFIATLYGMGDVESYACNIGMTVTSAPQQPTAIPSPVVHDTLILHDTVCQGKGYHQQGFDVNPEQTEETTGLILHDSIASGDTIHHRQLHLAVKPNATNELTINIIAGDTLLYNDMAISVAGLYLFNLTADNGCDSTVKLHVNYEAVEIKASTYGTCPGQMVMLKAEGTHACIWQSEPYDKELDDQQGRSTVRVRPRVTTTYRLLDTLGNVVATTIVGAEPAPRPCVDMQREVLDHDIPQVTLQDCSEGSEFTVWRYSDGVRHSSSRSRREFSHPAPEHLTVKMTTCNGYTCCADTTVDIDLRVRSVWFPESFSPTDGNGLFGCTTSCEAASFSIEVYNTIGVLAWRSNDVHSQWDGTSNGVPLPEGIYLYRWRLQEKNGKEQGDCGSVRLLK